MNKNIKNPFASKKRMAFIFILIVLLVLIFLRVISPEDDWICKDGQWIKHGNPDSQAPLGSCQNVGIFNKSVPLPNETDKINYALNDYGYENILKPEFKGKVFCNFHIYGYDKEEIISAYIWAYCEEYYKENNNLQMGSGVSLPLKLKLEDRGNVYKIIDVEKPQDGEGYPTSIKNLFPQKYYDQIVNGFDIKNFSESPKEKAEEYFK